MMTTMTTTMTAINCTNDNFEETFFCFHFQKQTKYKTSAHETISKLKMRSVKSRLIDKLMIQGRTSCLCLPGERTHMRTGCHCTWIRWRPVGVLCCKFQYFGPAYHVHVFHNKFIFSIHYLRNISVYTVAHILHNLRCRRPVFSSVSECPRHF